MSSKSKFSIGEKSSMTTKYEGVSAIYFYRLLSRIIKLGNLKNTDKVILDFGCGHGKLKKMLPKSKVIGYDVIQEYSEVTNWRDIPFEIFVANQVFYCMESYEVDEVLKEVKNKNPSTLLLIGTSRKGLLNKIGMYLLNKKDAHKGYKLSPNEEHLLLEKHCNLVSKCSVFLLADVYLYAFK
ncbi:class I SAM-dependent methyltransferase [Prochlorococcus sp. MIT 1341]|uniref:class I SAM-dependent methyltransferase n=1 Tax=Prochlorococcus sp. MIT 1341 TaxID=3096221 RepID=UPI002A74854E|nr:class I SAM-dependent methyltransferase [Prochlorococcus sp. MIT 1341]